MATVSLAAKWIGVAAMVFYGLMVLDQLIRYFRTATDAESVCLRSVCRRRRGGSAWGCVLAGYLLSRLVIIGSATAFAVMDGGTVRGILSELGYRWCRWDADHYLGLIENWYVTEGDERLHLVFFPLYPLLGRGLYLMGVPAYASALIVSNTAFLLAGRVMYALVELTGGRKAAWRAVMLLMFNPVSFFYSYPYTESVFLLMTLMAVYLARKRRFAAAVLFGALAASARMVGLTAAIPIFWEMLHAAWEKYAEETPGASPKDAAFLKKAFVCVLRVLPVAAGLAAYLALNARLHGNPFQFLIYQRENWSQETGTLARTIRYTLENAISFDNAGYRFGVWIPQAVALFAGIALMAIRRRRQHPGDAAYGLVYFYLSVMPTWLLSGTRYVSAMYSLYPLAAGMLNRRWKFAAAMAVSAALLAYMSVMSLNIGFVL